MKAISIGVAAVKLDNQDLGSVTAASIDLQTEFLTLHSQKVGQSMIAGSEFAIKSLSGSMNITTEEVGLVRPFLDLMVDSIKTGILTKKSFICDFPGSGGRLSGSVILMPQFSANVSIDGWSSISLQPLICGPISGLGGQSPTNIVGGVPFLDTAKKGAVTFDKNNLCYGVECNGIGVGELSLAISSQYRSIFRGDPPWPVDYVLDSVRVAADIGFYDFTSLDLDTTTLPISLVFKTIGGGNMTLNFGNLIKTFGGMKTSSSGVNTWHIKLEGNSF